MVTLVLGNVYSRLLSDDLAAVHAVADRLAIPVQGAKFTRWYKSGKWDGRHRFLERPGNRFLTGLLPIVRSVLADRAAVPTVIDKRDRPLPRPEFPAWAGPPLRGYQDRIVWDAQAKGRGIIKVGTGGGKTVIAGKLIGVLGVPTLFLVHRKELAQQALARFADWFGVHALGFIGQGAWNPEPITVAMIQTLAARLTSDPSGTRAFLDTRQLVVADECHRSSSDSWARVLQWTPAPYRYGLSGTPLVHDDVRDLKLQGLTGGLIADVSAAELAKAGWLAKPRCVFLPYAQAEDGRLGYRAAYDRLLVRNEARNRQVFDVLALHRDEQVLLIVRQIAHGVILRDLLASGGHGDIPFVSGRDRDADRQALYEAFREGRLRTLIASIIYDEGVDFPALDVVVNLAGGKTAVPLFQRLGRAMHREDTSRPVYYYDFMDEGNRYLAAHYRRRQRELRAAGFEVIHA